MFKRNLHFLFVAIAVIGCSSTEPEVELAPISVRSSIEGLEQRFDWARDTALSYAHSDGDSVGLWYEAALPGRDAFCMRDVSHQALGAHFLGLDAHTRNMLFQFARNVTDEKDWCSFWEITSTGQPASVDYRDDSAFWYNLPANFDVLDASYRMYQWTNDPTYIEHPVFLEFYERTVADYVERWSLDSEDILSRDRYMNRESFDMQDPYQYARGIPSYHESNQDATQLGIDLLAFQVAAYRSYAAILSHTGQPAKSTEYLSRAVRTSNLITQVFWKEDINSFHELLLSDHRTAMGGGMQVYALYNEAIPNPDKARAATKSLLENDPGNIEMRSHYPEVLYKYGLHAEALDMIMLLTDSTTSRRSYPEVSYSVVGAIATGLMGISPMEKGIATLSRIEAPTDWVELNHFSHGKSVASLRHEGVTSSTLSVLSGEKLLWRASFEGLHAELVVNGRRLQAQQRTDLLGNPVSFIEVEVYPLEHITISVFED
jgi:tetratricopeptide (TPR) repeat protein